jgi:hypothetical protein
LQGICLTGLLPRRLRHLRFRSRGNAKPLTRTHYWSVVRKTFITVTVPAAVIVFSNERSVVKSEPDPGGDGQDIPLAKQIPEVIHAYCRHPNTVRPAAVPHSKAVDRGTKPNPVLVVSVRHSRIIPRGRASGMRHTHAGLSRSNGAWTLVRRGRVSKYGSRKDEPVRPAEN